MGQARTQAYGEFASSRAGHLYRSACLLTSGDTYLAEDLVQETLGRMYVKWRGVAGIDNPAAYAQTVLVRTFLSHQRRRSSREHPTETLPDAPVPGAEDAELRLALLDGLARLAPKDRAVLVLRYWEDRSVEETAEAMRTSSNAVRTRSVRALGKLRELLGGSLTEFAGR